MADRFVNREPEVGRIENQVVLTGLDALRRHLLGGERRPALGVARHVERLDVLPALPRGASLVLVDLELAAVADGGRRERRADANQRLRDVGAFGRDAAS